MSTLIGKAQDFLTKKLYGQEIPTMKSAFYELIDRNMEGLEVPMSSFQGSVLCVVNVASKWVLTKMNYTKLSKLVDKYGDRGFKVLAFPCNQFNRQEPVSWMSWSRFRCLHLSNETITFVPPLFDNSVGLYIFFISYIWKLCREHMRRF